MRIIIVGGVAAGMSAAAKAKRVDPSAEVVVFEKGETVSYGACGLPYLVAGVTDDPDLLLVRTIEQFAKLDIAVHIKHQVLSVSPQAHTIQVRNLATGQTRTEAYDRLMIATGATPVMPNLPGMGLPGVYALKTLEDGVALRDAVQDSAEVVVAGGGYIGIEVAETLRSAGRKITIVEAAPHILSNFEPEIREKLARRMEQQGIDIRLSTPVQGIVEKNGVAAGVRTAAGNIPADVVVMALGIRPATAFLKDSGIALAENGAIQVDRRQRTNLPSIYAAGDCATVYNRVEDRNVWSPLATVANKCGRIAGENMAGGNVQFDGCLGSGAVAVCGWEAARTGMGEDTARQLVGQVTTTFIEANDRPRYYPGQTPIWIKLICEKTSGRILGGQAAGPKGAVLRVDTLAAAITMGMDAKTLGFTDFCYAPPFAEPWDALNIAGNTVKY